MQPLVHRGLSAQGLKWIAMAAMLGDHLAWAFLPDTTAAAILLHTLGAMAMPIFAFFIAEGYAHTRSLPAYVWRLALFALISYLPFVLFVSAIWDESLTLTSFGRLNMIYTLLLGLAALWVWQHVEQPELRLMAILALCLESLPGYGTSFPVLLVLAFGIARSQPKIGFTLATILCLAMFLISWFSLWDTPYTVRTWLSEAGFRLGQLAALGLLQLYNGRRGRGSRWIFYIFYPLHLLLLALLLAN